VNIVAETVNDTIRALLESTLQTMDALLKASDEELPQASSHVCAQGKDAWALITNDIDHEKIHAGQTIEGRYESRITQSPMDRLVAEWLTERTRFIGTLVGLTDDQYNSETEAGAWTYRQVASHVLGVEQDSIKVMHEDQAARSAVTN
jgi:hypothetical protein